MIPRPDLPPTSFPDVMCDLETTHTAPDRGHILQIAAVRFNLRTQEYDPIPFNVCLQPTMNHRMWSESTRDWWLSKPEAYEKATMNQIAPHIACLAFNNWLGQVRPTFWANRNGFDFMFLQSYFGDLGLPFPIKYWDTVDLLSYVRGLYKGKGLPMRSKKSVPFEGTAHDAVDDVLHQLKYLLMAETECGVSAVRPEPVPFTHTAVGGNEVL